MIWKAREHTFDFSKKKNLIVGILNITPDSFSDGNCFLKPEKACRRACVLEAEGADIIDIGAESTRPDSESITKEEELRRLLPALHMLRRKIKIPVSIDTTKADVAEECLKMGAAIINDVSGLKHDAALAAIVRKYKAGIILMHMRGIPRNMQEYTQYHNLMRDIIRELKESIAIAQEAGIPWSHIVLDPGIGFSKTAEQNFQILRSVKKLFCLKRPVMLGLSRKSFIGKRLKKDVHERLWGTLAAVAYGILEGVHLVRVHDVAPTKDIITILNAIQTT
jgi:dihydropteroate synthase